MKYEEIDGDLIKLAKEGKFDVIAHGCNCQCVMGAGLAPQMAKAFDCDTYDLEAPSFRGDMNKLGQIEYDVVLVGDDQPLAVVNAYTQFDVTGRREGKMDLDYDALKLCFKKMNHIFKGKHIGLPLIGCHLGGGDWNVVKKMIQETFTNCDVTIVHYSSK